MRKEFLFNEGWEFVKVPLGTNRAQLNSLELKYQPVDIPHDWLIYDSHQLYEDSTGWYKKEFELDWKKEKKYRLCFEGIYMDSSIYINGQKVAMWKYGYSTFEIDVTDYVQSGLNCVEVCVNHQAPNSRWYSGAGIYRNVWWKEVEETHIITNGVYIVPKKCRQEREHTWLVDVEIELAGEPERVRLSVWQAGQKICEQESNQFIVEKTSVPDEKDMATTMDCLSDAICHILKPNKQYIKINEGIEIINPVLWGLENPNLYQLQIQVLKAGQVVDEVWQSFGVRTIEFTTDKGMFLNGKPIKLQGTCEHHDLGALGAAFNKEAMRYRMTLLKEMGVNAIRTAHNMPAPEFMDLADEMGILIVSEAFDMWERSKTPYDYARFFKEWAKIDVASWVRRDRNHPSLIMWSIGNEIYDTHISENGIEITKRLISYVKEFDPKGDRAITIGSNYMPWENAQKCADIVKIAGYNYGESCYEMHHEEHPDWIIYGSETSSIVQSRGIYHFPLEQALLSDDDEQCSALGNSRTSWGAKSLEACITGDKRAAYSLGQFIWSGFDYIGEPTPYHTKNSYFGQLDTAGFKKDAYYVFQAEWTDYKKAPMVHIFPYWDFNLGQMIDVRVCSNGPEIELYLNDRLIGQQKIDHTGSENIIPTFKVPYEKGILKAIAYDENRKIIATDVRRSFGEAYEICLSAHKDVLKANGRDLAFVEIFVQDQEGHRVENATNYIQVQVKGEGRLIGLDNGDSTDYESYKGSSRRLFSGKLCAIIGATCKAGDIGITVTGIGLQKGVLTLQSVENGYKQHTFEKNEESPLQEIIPVRKIELIVKGKPCFNPQKTQLEVQANIMPSHATDQELIWKVVNNAAIPSHLATIEAKGNKAVVTALGDGNFNIRCMSKSSTDQIKIISQLECRAEGIGCAYLNPYEFVSGGLYDLYKGNPTNGNEKGVATGRGEETQLGYSPLDFGTFGSDEITIPIFALTDEAYTLQIWEGEPGKQGSTMLADVIYQKPSRWNVYQEETYRLNKRICGIKTLYFVLKDKVHIKGFSFKKLQKAYTTLKAIEADYIYGDQFNKGEEAVEQIGNNVSFEYEEMDFGEEGATKITLCGRSALEKNTIHLYFEDEEQKERQMVEFTRSLDYTEQSFTIHQVCGKKKLVIVFLPGSQFDFKWFRLEH